MLCGTLASGTAYWEVILGYLSSLESAWLQCPFLDASFYTSSQEFAQLRRQLVRGGRMKQTQALSLKRRGFLIVLFMLSFLNALWSCRVFGAGYPSLATMTVHDWYNQHQKRGVLPDQGIAKTSTGMSGRGVPTLPIPFSLMLICRPIIMVPYEQK